MAHMKLPSADDEFTKPRPFGAVGPPKFKPAPVSRADALKDMVQIQCGNQYVYIIKVKLGREK